MDAISPTESLLSYGLAGLIVVTFVIPLALYIKVLWERQVEDKNKQLDEKEAEIVRQRGELADLRRVLDPIADGLKEVGKVMNEAIRVIGDRR